MKRIVNIKQTAVWVFIVAVFAHAAVSWFNILTTTAPDFTVYYGAAKQLLAHKPLYKDAFAFTAFGYPPQTAFLYVPFLLLPYALAQAIWVSVSLVCVPAFVVLTMKTFGKQQNVLNIALWSSIFFLSFPTKFTLGMGQVNAVVLVLFLLVLYTVDKKKKTSGLLLGISLILKPQLLFFLPVFFVYKKYIPIAIALCLVLVITLVQFLLWGEGEFVSYVFAAIPDLSAFVGRDVYYNQSLGALFARLFGAGIASPGSVVASMSIYLLSVLYILMKKVSFTRSIFFLLPIFLLTEPVAWQHHFMFVLPVFVWLWYEGTLKEKGLLVVSFLLISANIKDPSVFDASLLLQATVVSHAFWGVVVLSLTAFLHTKKYSQ